MMGRTIKNLSRSRVAAAVITFALCAVLGWAVRLSFPKAFIPCAGAALAVAVFSTKPRGVDIDEPLRVRGFAVIGTGRRRRDDD